MGGSTLNRLSRRFIIETQAGTMGSVMQQFTDFPWVESEGERREPGLSTASLQDILHVDPDVIFVQTYAPSARPLSHQLEQNPTWQRLKAVQNQQVYEINQLWHFGNGTRILSLMLTRFLSLTYPAGLQ
jgi:iron complex transport system substrate-binding protein